VAVSDVFCTLVLSADAPHNFILRDLPEAVDQAVVDRGSTVPYEAHSFGHRVRIIGIRRAPIVKYMHSGCSSMPSAVFRRKDSRRTRIREYANFSPAYARLGFIHMDASVTMLDKAPNYNLPYIPLAGTISMQVH